MSILRQSAKGQECMMRIPGICSHNPETTVLAHENGGGLALKHDDLRATFACSACHKYYDNHKPYFAIDELTAENKMEGQGQKLALRFCKSQYREAIHQKYPCDTLSHGKTVQASTGYAIRLSRNSASRRLDHKRFRESDSFTDSEVAQTSAPEHYRRLFT